MVLSAIAIPFCLLAGQIRGNALAVRSVGPIASQTSTKSMDSAHVEQMIADALGDPTLQLACWTAAPTGYVDVRVCRSTRRRRRPRGPARP